MLPQMRHGLRPQRHNVSLFVSAGDVPVPFGRTRDLSVTGIFVEGHERPEIGTVLNLGFVWGEDSLICAARVMRHAVDGIGLMFVNPDAFFLRAVSEIIDATPPVRVVSGFVSTG